MPKYHRAVREIAMRFVKIHGINETSRRLEISRTTLWRWKKYGIIAKKRTYRSTAFERVKEAMREFVTRVQCTNAVAICKFLEESLGTRLCSKTVYKFLSKLQFSKKRVRTRGVSNQPAQPAIQTFKNEYRAHEAARGVFISVDESGFSERHRMLYGYSPRGAPCIVRTQGSWRNRSLLMAVYSTGEKVYEVHDGPIKKQVFASFIDRLPKSDKHIIIADNASIHKNLALNPRPTFLFTPPYEPDANPIEMCFAQVKRVYRERNNGHDTMALVKACVEDAVTPDLIRGCFAHVARAYVGQGM